MTQSSKDDTERLRQILENIDNSEDASTSELKAKAPKWDGKDKLDKQRRKILRPQGKSALKALIAGFKSNNRLKCHQPPGTGKTLLGIHVATSLNGDKVIVCVPWRMLVKQMVEVWSQETDYNILAVYSGDDQFLEAEDEVEFDEEDSNETAQYATISVDPVHIAAHFKAKGNQRTNG